MSQINMYSYVAASNPYFAKSLLHKFGYVVEKDQPLGNALQQLVAYEGEPALMSIIENNPDKELFMEYFEKSMPKKEDCGCNKGSDKLIEYMNFSGQIQAAASLQENKKTTTETSLMVLAGAMLIAFAIISKKL
jgi:hypothetical protein